MIIDIELTNGIALVHYTKHPPTNYEIIKWVENSNSKELKEYYKYMKDNICQSATNQSK